MQELGHIVGAGISPGHEDQRLISEVLRKDRKATAEFVARCTDYVYPFVYHRVMPRTEVVEDLTQEILLAAWQSLLNFRLISAVIRICALGYWESPGTKSRTITRNE